MWNLGLLGASLPLPVSNYELIESAILASNTPSVTFSNLNTYSSTYKHLQIRYVWNSTIAAETRIRYNGDTGANYRRHFLQGNGSSVISGSQPDAVAGGYNEVTNPTSTIIDILDFSSTTKNKTSRAVWGFTGNGYIGMVSGLWFATPQAITSIELSPTSGNYATGSRFSLYGIKG
jgi:hypothetical protein